MWNDRYAKGEALSPLDGVPYAVIDSIDATPYPTTSGSTFVRLHSLRVPKRLILRIHVSSANLT